jgi:nucleotide-binding universal stress UspA family protein
VTFFHTVPAASPADTRHRIERDLAALARDEAAGPYEVVVEPTDDPRSAIVRHAAGADLVVMGTERRGRGRPRIGDMPLAIARETGVPLLMISRRPTRALELGLEISSPSFLSS